MLTHGRQFIQAFLILSGRGLDLPGTWTGVAVVAVGKVAGQVLPVVFLMRFSKWQSETRVTGPFLMRPHARMHVPPGDLTAAQSSVRRGRLGQEEGRNDGSRPVEH